MDEHTKKHLWRDLWDVQRKRCHQNTNTNELQDWSDPSLTPSISLFFNKTPLSVCLSALSLPFLPPPCPLCEADGPACRGGLTRRPHAAKEEPDVLCHATSRCSDSPDRDLSRESTVDFFLFNQRHCLGYLHLTHWELKAGHVYVLLSIMPSRTHIWQWKNAVLLIFLRWKRCPRKKLTEKNPGSVCLLQESPQKNNFIWARWAYPKKKQLAWDQKVKGSSTVNYAFREVNTR